MTIHPHHFQPASGGVDPVIIRTQGATLAGRLYRPQGRASAVAVLHGAVGVPQSFYRAFAEWLSAERDVACMTYDYRDFGASTGGHLARSRVTLADWGIADQTAAMARARQLVPEAPLWVIGHSLGGVMMPLHGEKVPAERVITVGSGLVHLTDHPWPYRLLATAFWHGHVPALTLALGYMPGRRIGFGPDLPAGVYWQWRRWCTTRGFYLGDVGRTLPMPRSDLVTADMKIVAIGDDPVVPPAAVWRLMAMYPDARKRQLVLRPGEYGLRRLGHVGPFARENRAVWPALVA